MPANSKLSSERPPTARDLCDRLGHAEVDSVWTRDDAQRWWETRMEAEAAVTCND
jgi:hypothetical protein